MSQGEAPPPRKHRPWWRGLLVAGILLLAVIAAAAGFRKQIAEGLARAYLDGQGIAITSLEVSVLSLDLLEVRNIALGEADELTVNRLRVEPGLLLAAVRTARLLTLQGLELKVDLTGEGPPLGSLQTFLDDILAEDADSPTGRPTGGGSGDQAGDAAAFPVQQIVLSDSSVIFATPSGPMTAALDGSLTPDDTGGLGADATLSLDSDLGQLQADLLARRSGQGDLDLTAQVTKASLVWEQLTIDSFTGSLDAGQAAGKLPRVTADFDLAGFDYAPAEGPALQLATGSLQLAGTPARAEARLVLEGGAERLEATFDARQETDAGGQLIVFDLEGEARTAGGLAQFLSLSAPALEAGALVVQAAGQGRPSRDLTTAASWQDLPALLGESSIQLRADAILAEVALSDGTSGISAHLPLAAEIAEGRAVFSLTEDAFARVERPARASLRDLGVPDDFLPLLASGLNLTLAAAGERPFSLTAAPAWPPRDIELVLTGSARSDQELRLSADLEGSATLDPGLALGAFSGTLDARADTRTLSLGGREARGVALDLPLSARYDEAAFNLALVRPGTLRIAAFGADAPLRLQEPLAFELDTLSLTAPRAEDGYSYSLQGREDGAAFAILAAENDPLDITAGALEVRLQGSFAAESGHAADFVANLASFELPARNFTAEAARIEVALDRELRPRTSRFALGPFQIRQQTAPLLLAGNLQRRGAGYDLSGELGLAGGTALADISGRYDDDGRARLQAASKALSFEPDGLQPAQISPRLEFLEDVRGELSAEATLAWPRDLVAERGQLTLSGLSFGGPAEVEDLDLSLQLDRLLPPGSAANQHLTIRRLEAGVPVENIDIAFSLDPRPQLDIEDGGFDLAGARWRIDPTVIDPAAERHHITLGTEALDLATFFELIGVQGLSGSGTLKGKVPIVFAEGDVIIEDGRFEAQEPGHLSIRFEALRSALAGGGQTVELAIKALEDFQYENLSVTLAKTAANDATVRLSTLGSNPEVLDGQPFQFNINLESNLTSVLEALKQGYSLSDEALRRAWRLRE
ncbi:MAG: hypothetical protein Tsb0032_29180 [Kiloniellaceae bacterium]